MALSIPRRIAHLEAGARRGLAAHSSHDTALPREQRRVPLGASERYFAALRSLHASKIARVLVLENAPSARAVAAALHTLGWRHPLLRVRIEEGATPAYVYGDTLGPMLQVVDRHRSGDPFALLERVLSTRAPGERSPLFEAYYVHTPGDGVVELLLAADHTIADDVSMNQLCAELMAFCAGGGDVNQRPERPVLAAMLPTFSRADTLHSLRRTLPGVARNQLRRTLFARTITGSATSYACTTLAPTDTTALQEEARLANTTLTVLLMASVLSALPSSRQNPLTLRMSVNLRAHLPEHQLSASDLGNYSASAYIASAAHSDTWLAAHALQRTLEHAQGDALLLPSLVTMYRTERRFLRAKRPIAAHAMLSHCDKVPLARSYGACLVRGFYGATSAATHAAGLAFSCHIFDARLCIGLAFSEERVHRHDAEGVLARVRRTLIQARL